VSTSGDRRRSAGRGASGLLAVAFLVGLLPACSHTALPQAEVDRWLRAWERGDSAEQVRQLDPAPATGAAEVIARFRTDLHLSKLVARPGRLRRRAGGVDAPITVDATVSGLGPWRYTTALHLVRVRGAWRVAWSPAVLHPALRTGEHLARTRKWPARAAIVGVDGTPLAAPADAFAVGLEPDRIKDRPSVEHALQTLLGADPAAIEKALSAPNVKPNFFVPVQTLDPPRFAALRPQLEPLPGVVFQKTTARLGPAPGVARHVVGTVSEATAEELTRLGAPYEIGDVVGHDGLEAAEERTLAGTPTGDVHVVTAAGAAGAVLHSFAGTPPQPVTTTIDAHVQAAAERALSAVSKPAALVAVDVATADIRAVVSRPLDQAFNRALTGRYPPGSTAKLATSVALVGHGVTPDSRVTCPTEIAVAGKKFTNFEGEAPGPISFRQAFAISCNTAFVGEAAKLKASDLTDAAHALGFGVTYRLPIAAAGGQWPDPADAADQAAEAIGQGRVVASPLHMATVVAAIGAGTWHAPRLLAIDRPGQSVALDGAVATTIRDLMAGVVGPGGTGAAAAVAGKPLIGKTGTAEFGSKTPPETHAWFVGISGPIAFAIVVEGGGVGGRVAAPLAAAFVAAL
jgi:cell division protein FtsI/penicillin-binding protein 2